MPTNKGFYDVLELGERLIPGLSLKIERNVSCDDAKADISELVTLPTSELEWRRLSSVALEQVTFNEILAALPKWEEQAAFTQLLDRALEYQKTPVCTHTSNQRGVNGVGHNMVSNMTYMLVWHIYEKTRYDRKAGGTVPLSWHVTWNLYTNPPSTSNRDSSIQKVAGQDNKPFTDKAAAEKYLNGRIAAYAHLFTEISPPVPKEYAKAFSLHGLLLPGYSVAEEGLMLADRSSRAGRASVRDQLAGAREAKRQATPEKREPDMPGKTKPRGRDR